MNADLRESVASKVLGELRRRKGLRHLLEQIECDDPEIYAEIEEAVAATALRAVADAGPSEKMVEAVVGVMLDETLKQRVSQIQGFSDYPNSTRHWIRDFTLRRGDDVIWDGGPSSEEMLAELDRIKARVVARAAIGAALKEMG